MATYTKYDSGINHLATDINCATDTFKIALTNTAPNVGTHEFLADATEISAGNGYSAGGVTIGTTSSETGGTFSLTPSGDVVITASGGTIGPFRYAVFYSDTPTNDPLLSSFDYGSSITLNDGESLTIDVSATLFTMS